MNYDRAEWIGVRTKRKTVKEWFETLPQPIRSKALNNLDPESADERTKTLYDALVVGFTWSRTPEGNTHWSKIAVRLYEGQQVPTEDEFDLGEE